MSRIAIVLAALGTCTWTPGKMEDNDSCLPDRCAEQCATTVLQKRSRHPSTCWGKVALLASWGVMILCLLWWNFCSRLEKNVLCRAGMIVIHDFHICLLMWKLRAPGFARTTCFSAKKWNHGFQREMSWCNSCLSCPEETKGFLSERVARKLPTVVEPQRGLPEGGRFSVEEKKQCEIARCAIRPRKLESDEIGYFHACSPSKFVALVVLCGWDDIGCQPRRYLQDELERTFYCTDCFSFSRIWRACTLAREQLVSWYCFLAHWEFTCPMSSFPEVPVSVQRRATGLPFYSSPVPCWYWSCITRNSGLAYFRSCIAFRSVADVAVAQNAR